MNILNVLSLLVLSLELASAQAREPGAGNYSLGLGGARGPDDTARHEPVSAANASAVLTGTAFCTVQYSSAPFCSAALNFMSDTVTPDRLA
jgi:hypothetical protein